MNYFWPIWFWLMRNLPTSIVSVLLGTARWSKRSKDE